MRESVPFYIALRYIRSESKKRSLSTTAFVSVAGLTVGVAVMIVVLSVINGFDKEIKNRILGAVPQVSLHAYPYIYNWNEIVNDVITHDEVIAGAPYVSSFMMLMSKGNTSNVMVKGVLPNRELLVSDSLKYLVQGDISRLREGSYGIILGKPIANSLRLSIGSHLVCILPRNLGSFSVTGFSPSIVNFTLVGIVDTKSELDNNLAIVHMGDLSKSLDTGGGVHGIQLRVKDLFEAPKVARQLYSDKASMYYARDWTQQYGNLYMSVASAKQIFVIILLLIVLVAAFNVMSGMVMTVTDKQKEVAILRVLGAGSRTILKIFLIQGALIAIIGVAAGVALGTLIASNLTTLVALLESWLEVSLFNYGAYPVSFLPSEIIWSQVFLISIVSIFISISAAIPPSVRALRVIPVRALQDA